MDVPLGTTILPRTGRLGQSAESLCSSPPVSAGPAVAGGGGVCSHGSAPQLGGGGGGPGVLAAGLRRGLPTGLGRLGLAATWVLDLLWDPATPLLVTLGVWSPPRAQTWCVSEPESGRGCVPWSLL